MHEDKLSLKTAYQNLVNHLKEHAPINEAMEMAVGGGFKTVGPIEVSLVQHFGLGPDGYLVDVGCGSGRLAKPLSAVHPGKYFGFDLIHDLVEYAKTQTARPDWRFEVIDHIAIPEESEQADMVCFFSVLTHLLHEQSYWYLEEAKRVLRPGGKAVFSFLEFSESTHWPVFEYTLSQEKTSGIHPLNVFIDRASIQVWAQHLDMKVVSIYGANESIVREGPLGQSICVLSKG